MLRLVLLFTCTLLGSLQAENVQLQVAANDEVQRVTSLDLHARNWTVREHCPQLSDLPIVNVKGDKFFACRIYQGLGHSVPDLSCNGKSFDGISGYRQDAPDGQGIPMGSLYVHAGCSFYGFKGHNYQGDYTQYDGPLFVSKLQNTFDNNCDGIPCPHSFLVDCRMHMPDCVPTDKWATVASYDNSGSSLVSTFTYKYTIGTSWSNEMSEGFSISSSVTYEMKASFWGIFEESLSVSETTGYDWSETSTQAQNEEQEFSVETLVPGGVVIQIQQAKGICGDSDVKTEMFRTLETKKNGEVISDNIFFH